MDAEEAVKKAGADVPDEGELPCVSHSVTKGLEGRLRQNILREDYFQSVARELNGSQTIAEEAAKLESPEMNSWGGAARLGIGSRRDALISFGARGDGSLNAPTPLWCLLVRLLESPLAAGDLRSLLRHSSPQVKVLGALFARFTLPPVVLVDWFEPLLSDSVTKVVVQAPSARGAGREESLRDVARGLLLEERHLGTLLPRVPKRVSEEIQKRLQKPPPKPAAPTTAAAPAAEESAPVPEAPAPEVEGTEEEKRRQERYRRLDELVEFYRKKDEEAVKEEGAGVAAAAPTAPPAKRARSEDPPSPPRDDIIPAPSGYLSQRQAQVNSATSTQARTAVRKLASLLPG
eukprot:Hpha_TRINITY_DN18937_c0_g1::TRINITY_DN18937_c0_g1_i1::g.17428::m.17428/K12850/PRPF38B; pre-mRNA-splicing factor 38B